MINEILTKIDKNQILITQARPFEGALLEQIRDFYRIGLTYTSNALEGNTLTESETKVLLEDGLTAGGKPLRHTFEALGHAEAYDFLFTLLGSRQIDKTAIITMHWLFYQNIDRAAAGVFRLSPVIITGSRYAVTEAEVIPAEMEALILWANESRHQYHPVEFAAQLHKRFVFIHPFIDGNGRVARLLMNAALIQDGFLPVIIPPVLRAEYIGFLEKAHVDDSNFIEFIAERTWESQRDMMRMLHIKE